MVRVGDTRGKTIFTFAYWKEFSKMKHFPISIELGTSVSCMMGIQVYSNEG
jgi:hypothetical protein